MSPDSFFLPHVVFIKKDITFHFGIQVLYHTPKSSFSRWDEKQGSYIFSIKDLPFFVSLLLYGY